MRIFPSHFPKIALLALVLIVSLFIPPAVRLVAEGFKEPSAIVKARRLISNGQFKQGWAVATKYIKESSKTLKPKQKLRVALSLAELSNKSNRSSEALEAYTIIRELAGSGYPEERDLAILASVKILSKSLDLKGIKATVLKSIPELSYPDKYVGIISETSEFESPIARIERFSNLLKQISQELTESKIRSGFKDFCGSLSVELRAQKPLSNLDLSTVTAACESEDVNIQPKSQTLTADPQEEQKPENEEPEYCHDRICDPVEDCECAEGDPYGDCNQWDCSTPTPTLPPAETATPTETATATPTPTPHCYTDEDCAYKEDAVVCSECASLLTLNKAICNDEDEPDLSPQPCKPTECCIGAGCIPKTGEVSLSLSGTVDSADTSDSGRCSDNKNDIYYSNEQTVSGSASVDGLNVGDPDCVITLSSGVGSIYPTSCKGSEDCSFTITRSLTPGELMCGEITATASAACCSEKIEKKVGLSNYGFKFNPATVTVNEGPIQAARRPRIKLVPYPSNLKVEDHSENLLANSAYRNLKGPKADTEKAPGTKDTFRITSSWWVGVSKSPPKSDLCKDDVNEYKLSANAFLQRGAALSLTYNSLPHNIFFKLKSKFSGKASPYFTTDDLISHIENEIKNNYVKIDGLRTLHNGTTYCLARFTIPKSGSFAKLLAPATPKMASWSPTSEQYYSIIKAEETLHTQQATGMNWKNGGLGDVLDYKNVHMSHQIFSGPNCPAAVNAGLTEFGIALRPVFQFLQDWGAISGPIGCWKEQRAKELVGLTAEVAGFHLECAYPDCTKQNSAPPLPFS